MAKYSGKDEKINGKWYPVTVTASSEKEAIKKLKVGQRKSYGTVSAIRGRFLKEENGSDWTSITGLGAVRSKPTLKKGDKVEIKGFVSKRDMYGNPYNSGQVFLNNKLIGEWGKNWGGKGMAEQNGKKILSKTTFKPRGKSDWSSSMLRSAGVTMVYKILEDIPIRKFNKYYA